MNLENKVKNRFNVSEILKSLLLKVSKLEKNIIPAQVNSDWNATSGVTQILNKPTIYTKPYREYIAFISQTGVNDPTVEKLIIDEIGELFFSRVGIGVYNIYNSLFVDSDVTVNDINIHLNDTFEIGSTSFNINKSITYSGGPVSSRGYIIPSVKTKKNTVDGSKIHFRSLDNNEYSDNVLNKMPMYIHIKIFNN